MPSSTFTNLSPVQKQQLEALETKAGYPAGLIELGQKTFKEEAADQKEIYQNATIEIKQRMADLKQQMGDKVHFSTDLNGTVTATIFDPFTNKTTTENLGAIGTPQSQYTFGTDADGNPIKNNRFTGESNLQGGGGQVVQPPGKYDVASSGDGIKVQVQKGDVAGQCGHFVNQYLGKNIVADSYQSKKNLVDKSITEPSPGDIFVMAIYDKNGKLDPNGHIGIVETSSNGKANVVDSNWHKDETIDRHSIPMSKIYGYFHPGNSGSSSNSVTKTMKTTTQKISPKTFAGPTSSNSELDKSYFSPSGSDVQDTPSATEIMKEYQALYGIKGGTLTKAQKQMIIKDPETAWKALQQDKKNQANKKGGAVDNQLQNLFQ